MRLYIILFKFQNPGDKKPGPVRQFRIYAGSYDEARRLMEQQGNYPNLEIVSIKQA